jgi:hypothetical protein
MGADELPRLAGLEGFELWDRTFHTPAHVPAKTAFVSVRIHGTVGISLACYAMWGSPPACLAMFDPERRRLALKPCEPGAPNSFPLDDRQKDVPLRNLFAYYGVQIVETRRYYDPKVMDAVLVVDL